MGRLSIQAAANHQRRRLHGIEHGLGEIRLAAVEDHRANSRVQQGGGKQCRHGTDAAAEQAQGKAGEVALLVDPADGIDQPLRPAWDIKGMGLRLAASAQVEQESRYGASTTARLRAPRWASSSP
jgi:hypothetical protein